eukprot:1958107-Pyramimonas_sp.AAC.1
MHRLHPPPHMEDLIIRDCTLLRGRNSPAFPRTSCKEQWQTGARGGFTEVIFDTERLAFASVYTGLW